MWIRWQHKFADRAGEFEWMYVGKISKEHAEKYFKEFFREELSMQYEFSMNYRGINYFAEENAPKEIIEKKIVELRNNIEANVKTLRELILEIK